MPVSYISDSFYAAVRQSIFAGHMTPAQVEGCDKILAEAGRRSLERTLTAYILATAFWESGHTMQPVSEVGKGRTRPYGKPDPQTGLAYYGRGLVQLTWKSNYQTFSKVTSLDLAGHPELALRLDVAIQILFEGMIRGLFTGKKLSDFLSRPHPDFFNARRVVNGTDKASEIAALARTFEAALIDTPASVAPTPVKQAWFDRLKAYF